MRRWEGKSIKVDVLYSRMGIAQQIWVGTEGGSLLVDAGDGVLRDLVCNGFDASQIRGMIFTHGHFDHMGGVHSVLGFLKMIGREELLLIVAPKGCREVFSIVDNFKRCYVNSIPFEISIKECEPQEVFQIGDMTIKAYPVVHCGSTKGSGILDPIPAVGYRISCGGETVSISGDTGFCASLKELVKGADLAILEATVSNESGVSEEFLEKVHLSEEMAKEIGKLAKDFILVHKHG